MLRVRKRGAEEKGAERPEASAPYGGERRSSVKLVLVNTQMSAAIFMLSSAMASASRSLCRTRARAAERA